MGAMCCVLRDAKNIGELHALPLAPSASGITSFHRGLRGGSSDRRDTEGRPLSDSQGSRADSNSGLFPSYSGPGSSLWGVQPSLLSHLHRAWWACPLHI